MKKLLVTIATLFAMGLIAALVIKAFIWIVVAFAGITIAGYLYRKYILRD